MPLYEYKCKQCGVIEIIQKISEKPLIKCPKCSKNIEKIFSVTGEPIFVGSGFYKTDYRANKQNK